MILLHLVQSFDGGGVSKVIINLLSVFDKMGYYNVIFTPTCSEQYIRASNECVECPQLKFLRPFNSYIYGSLVSRSLSERLKRLPYTPDAIIVHPGWYAASLRELANTYANIVVVHGTYLNELRFIKYHPIRGHERVRYLLGIKLSHQNEMMALKEISTFSDRTAIVAVSNETRKELTTIGMKSHKVFAVLNGVNKSLFRFIGKEIAEEILKRKYGIEIKGATIAHVGLGAIKGTHTLVKALAMLKERGVKFTALFAGRLSPNTFRQHIMSLIERFSLYENIKLLGWVSNEDLPYIYNVADVTVVPSYSEGAPLVIPESLACGTPVIATDVGGNKEYLELVDLGDLLIELTNYDFSTNLFLKLYNAMNSIDQVRPKLLGKRRLIPSWEDVGMEYLNILKKLASV